MKTAEACVHLVVLGGVGMLAAACALVIDPDLLVAQRGAGVGDGAGEAGACPATSECADAPPDGWTTILLAADTRPSCPSGYVGATDVSVVDGDGTTTCACDCGNNCGATLTVTTGTELTCTTAPALDSVPASTACGSTSLDVPSGFAMVASEGGTCAATDRTTKSSATNGRTCTPQETAGAGCQAGRRCLPPAAGFELCVAKRGQTACPSAVFTKLRRVGTAVDDRRGCAGCSCTSNPCDVELVLWSRPNCQGREETTITGKCVATDAASNVKSYKSKTTNGCTEATPSAARGEIVFENEETICCR